MSTKRKEGMPVAVFARVHPDAHALLMQAVTAANEARGVGDGAKVTVGHVLERCILETLSLGERD